MLSEPSRTKKNALVDKTAETQASQKLIKNEIWLIIVDTKIMSGGVSNGY